MLYKDICKIFLGVACIVPCVTAYVNH